MRYTKLNRDILSNSDILYADLLSQQLIEALRDVQDQMDEENTQYLFHSPARAKFKRLRVELAKELMEIQGRIYN